MIVVQPVEISRMILELVSPAVSVLMDLLSMKMELALIRSWAANASKAVGFIMLVRFRHLTVHGMYKQNSHDKQLN